MKKLAVAIIGTGFGVRTQLPAFRLAGGWNVVSLTGRDAAKTARLAEEHDVPHALTSVEDATTVGDPDLVCVTTPPAHHHPMGLRVVEAERHCLLDKPMALDAREASSLVKAARRGRSLSLIDHQLRALPNRQEMKRRLESGDVGVPLHARVSFTSHSRGEPGRLWNWWSREADGGGLLGAIGSHVVDSLLWWFGDVTEVVAALKTAIPARLDANGAVRKVETDDVADLHLTFRSALGASVALTSVAHHYAGFTWEIHGTDGSLWIDSDGRLFAARRDETERHDVSLRDNLGDDDILDGSLWARGFALFAAALGGAIRGEHDLPFAATFADGLRTQRIIDAARLSAREGRKIVVKNADYPSAARMRATASSTASRVMMSGGVIRITSSQ